MKNATATPSNKTDGHDYFQGLVVLKQVLTTRNETHENSTFRAFRVFHGDGFNFESAHTTIDTMQVVFFSANGAFHTSLGRSPRTRINKIPEG
jgi:hypothetical protein